MARVAAGLEADQRGVLLDHARDRAVRQPLPAHVVVTVDGAEDGAAADLGGLEPALHGAHRAGLLGRAKGMPTRRPRASWSVFVLHSVTTKPLR